LDHCLHFFWIFEVGGKNIDTVPEFLASRFRGFQMLDFAGMQRQVGAEGCQLDGQPRSQASGCAGDENILSVKKSCGKVGDGCDGGGKR